MYTATERDISMMKLVVKVKPRARIKELSRFPFAQVPFSKVADDCVAMFTERGRTLLRKYKKGKVITYLRDAEVLQVGRHHYLALLLAVSDKRRPDEVLSDPTTEARREIRKDQTEGSEYSCHVVIRLEPDSPGGGRYSMAFEVVPNFGITFIHWYLRYLFRLLSGTMKYSVADPSGARNNKKAAQIPVQLATEVHAVPSDQLLRDLNNGELAEIELSREVQGYRGFDQTAFTTEKRSTLVLKPTQKALGGKALDVITGVCMAGNAKHFQVAKVRWLGDAGRAFSANFDCATTSVISDRYVKKLTLDLPAPMLASCDVIEADFASRLASWIK